MRQRVAGAIAISCQPSLLLADEPTTSLDVTIQAQYLRLLKDIQRQTNVALIFVTHDLGIVAKMCDRVAVMYAGRIVESGTPWRFLPVHGILILSPCSTVCRRCNTAVNPWPASTASLPISLTYLPAVILRRAVRWHSHSAIPPAHRWRNASPAMPWPAGG
jgi:energy-coupling factor transporter ATP-binding protein EcfA2